jgi:hypothetical protein
MTTRREFSVAAAVAANDDAEDAGADEAVADDALAVCAAEVAAKETGAVELAGAVPACLGRQISARALSGWSWGFSVAASSTLPGRQSCGGGRSPTTWSAGEEYSMESPLAKKTRSPWPTAAAAEGRPTLSTTGACQSPLTGRTVTR